MNNTHLILTDEDWKDIIISSGFKEVTDIFRFEGIKEYENPIPDFVEVKCKSIDNKDHLLRFSYYGVSNYSDTGESDGYIEENNNPICMLHCLQNSKDINKEYIRLMIDRSKEINQDTSFIKIMKSYCNAGMKFVNNIILQCQIDLAEVDKDRSLGHEINPEYIDEKLGSITVAKTIENGFSEMLEYIKICEKPYIDQFQS